MSPCGRDCTEHLPYPHGLAVDGVSVELNCVGLPCLACATTDGLRAAVDGELEKLVGLFAGRVDFRSLLHEPW